MIALLSSVPEEGRQLARGLRKAALLGGKLCYRGILSGQKVVYCVSGMGKTNAAHAATLLLERYTPDIMVLFGIGGAYPAAGLTVGDIAVAEKEVYGDEGVLDEKGFHTAESIGIPFLRRGGKKYFNEFPLTGKFPVDIARFFPSAVKSGTFVTVSTCSATHARARELEKRFDAVCENMEGAAVAHLSALYDVPLIEIRGISNIAGERDKAQWDIRGAASMCQKILREWLKSLPQP